MANKSVVPWINNLCVSCSTVKTQHAVYILTLIITRKKLYRFLKYQIDRNHKKSDTHLAKMLHQDLLALECCIKHMVLQRNENSFLKSMQISACLRCSLFVFPLTWSHQVAQQGPVVFAHSPCALLPRSSRWLQTIIKTNMLVLTVLYINVYVYIHTLVAETPCRPHVDGSSIIIISLTIWTTKGGLLFWQAD